MRLKALVIERERLDLAAPRVRDVGVDDECVRAALGMMQEGIDEVRRNGGRALDQLMACMRSYSAIVCEEFGKCVIRIGEDPLPEPLKKELRRLKAWFDEFLAMAITPRVLQQTCSRVPALR